MNIYEKIQAVSNEIKNIEKDMTVGKGVYSYKAVSDLQVTLAVKDAETKYKLISIPYKQELISSEVVKTVSEDNGKEKLTYVENIKMTVKIVNLEDVSEFIEIESFGKGVDSSDKGFGKASTYARKYALLNAYKIATGEDPDAEQGKPKEVAKNPSEKRIAVENYLNNNIEALQQTLQHFNIGSIADATEKIITSMYETLSKKGKIQ